MSTPDLVELRARGVSVADLVQELVDAGASPQMIAIAVRAVETAGQPRPRSAGAIRQARYRAKASQGVTSDVTTDAHGDDGDVTGDVAEHNTVPSPSPPRDINSTPPSTPSTERSARATPRSILLGCLSAEMTEAVIDHRRAKRSPLTVAAAKLLAKSLVETGDPPAAVEMMIERGWTAIKPSWFEREKSNGRVGINGKISVQEAARKLAASPIDFGPIPPPYMPSGRGNASSCDSPRLLSEGGCGRPGDVLGGRGFDLVLLPGASRLSCDGPEIGTSGEEPMASDRGRSSSCLRS
jgi:hypothetical protein